MQNLMNEPNLKLKDPINIHWLALENAIKTIHKFFNRDVSSVKWGEEYSWTNGEFIAEGLLK